MKTQFVRTGVAALALACAGAAQSQSCPCNGGTGTLLTTQAATQTVLSNKMVCASSGNETWQEWHNGGTSGPVVDYKKGPADPVDPSATVGQFAIAADGTVTYNYGTSSYKYSVCQTSGTYAFCGSPTGGRDFVGVRLSTTTGLQSCASVNISGNVIRTK